MASRVLRLAALALALAAAGRGALAQIPGEITVVTDINFPPYLFPAEDGKLQGIVKDKWELWSRTTGVKVNVEGVEWRIAQATVLSGDADVIETLAFTEARSKLYEYSPPYAPIEAHVYFHRSVSGVNDVASLRGFTIGAKDGSACGNWLSERGVENVRKYATSQAVIGAAVTGEIRLFCMDAPAAQYFLVKRLLEDDFRRTPPLYTTQFHWAVRKGRPELRDAIQRGFDRIPKSELEAVDARWIGNPVRFPIDPRYQFYLAFLVGAIVIGSALMVAWTYAMRRRVAARTAELQRALADVERKALEVRDLYNNAPCGYHSCGLDGLYIEINDTELQWLGATREQVIGKKGLRDFLSPASAREFDEKYPKFRESTRPVNDLDFELLRADGTTMNVLLSASAILGPDGKFVRSRTTLYDVTARRRAEQEVRDLNADLERKVMERTAELASANQELESFSYSVSHDLRAPLRAIEGFMQLAIESGAGEANPGAKGYLERVRGAGQRMSQLVDSLLELSRISRGRLARVQVDLARVAQEIVGDLKLHGAWDTTEVTIDPALKVAGDPALLRVALDNLIRNAFKFSANATPPRVAIGRETVDGRAAIFVRDNGVGFDANYADKLFVPFQRLHSVDEFPGTGIGLAIVARIVERHGGKAWAQSTPGAGATFYFTLG